MRVLVVHNPYRSEYPSGEKVLVDLEVVVASPESVAALLPAGRTAQER